MKAITRVKRRKLSRATRRRSRKQRNKQSRQQQRRRQVPTVEKKNTDPCAKLIDNVEYLEEHPYKTYSLISDIPDFNLDKPASNFNILKSRLEIIYEQRDPTIMCFEPFDPNHFDKNNNYKYVIIKTLGNFITVRSDQSLVFLYDATRTVVPPNVKIYETEIK